jgi:DNA modification methylase
MNSFVLKNATCDIKLFHGDCLEILPTITESIHLIATDPPYPKQYMALYWKVIDAAISLVSGGSYLAIVPHYSLPLVLEEVGKRLKYRWTCCMWQAKGSHPRMAMGIEVMWKPIVWWVKDKWPQGRGFVVDGFENNPPSKDFHEWEQAFSWAEYCLKFVPLGGLVVDPFMGSGTLGILCAKKNISFIGIEKDEKTYNIAKQRIEEIVSSNQK